MSSLGCNVDAQKGYQKTCETGMDVLNDILLKLSMTLGPGDVTMEI